MIQIIIGWIMAFWTIIMYVPQTWKVIKQKNAKGLSKITFFGLNLAIIFFVNWSPMLFLWESWVANAILIFLLLPVQYYIFHDVKKTFYSILLMNILSFVISLLQLLLKIKTHQIVSMTFAFAGGFLISIVFLPQTLISIKTKSGGGMSILTVVMIMIGNALWVTYFALALQDTYDVSLIIQIIFSSIAIMMQVPIAYFLLKAS